MVGLPGPRGCPTAVSASAWVSRAQGLTPPFVAAPVALPGELAALLLPACCWVVGFTCPAVGVELLLHAASSSEPAMATVVDARRWFVMAVSVIRFVREVWDCRAVARFRGKRAGRRW